MFEQEGSASDACFEVFVLCSNPAGNHCARSLFGDERREAAAECVAVRFVWAVPLATAEVTWGARQRVFQNGQSTVFDPGPALCKEFKRLFAQVNVFCGAVPQRGAEDFVHEVPQRESRVVAVFFREGDTCDFFVEVLAWAGQVVAYL